ncbi:probable HVA22-like protein e at N-terminal half [Coccomyxa sp. Obi]|nr:probable HVA22-like protein e at N-terminal half [Coccomyxa sp. Obi]
MSFRVVLVYTLNLFFGLLYPTAKSIEAVESAEGGHDDAQWLMYWIIYTLLLITETLLWPALKWVPLYGEAKAMLLAWLVLPQFKGATWVYETIIGPGTAKLRTELQKIPALERMLNQEDAATSQALSSEEEIRSVEERKTRVTLTTQEARDALISKLHDIEGIADAKARQKAWKAFDEEVAKVARVGNSKYA